MYRIAFFIAKTCMPLVVAALLVTGCATTKSIDLNFGSCAFVGEDLELVNESMEVGS